MNITIIGAGMMGSAMAGPANDNGHFVNLVGTPLDREIIDSVKKTGYHPTLRHNMGDKVRAFQIEELDEVLKSTDFIVCGVSSFGAEWFANEILPKLPSGKIVLSITKGLQPDPEKGLVTFPDYWKNSRQDLEFVAVGGPCICFELMDKMHTLVYFCSRNIEAAKEAANVMKTDYYHLVVSDNVEGVECSVAMKNAYALGVSLAVGLSEKAAGITTCDDLVGVSKPGAVDRNPKYNPQAALFGQSCVEMRRVIEMFGGKVEFGGGIPGAGDLYVTVFGGRTRKIGTLLGRGFPFPKAKEILNGVTLESVSIITRMAKFVRDRGREADFPLLAHMDEIINKGAEVKILWDKFGEV